MSLSRSFSSFFSTRHRDTVGGMQVSLDDWCPNPYFYFGRATSLDGLGFIPVQEESCAEEEEETEEEEEMEEETKEEEMVADPGPPSSPRPSKQSIIMDTSEDTSEFYTKGKSYWETVPATIDGMLGGYSNVHNADFQASSRFLSAFINDKTNPLNTEKALDCGCGIGRVTKHLLLKFFKSVDMVEQNKEFLDASHKYLGEDDCRVSQRFNCGLQDFNPEEKHYDVIWTQWVTGHLTDDDFVAFLKRCKKGLKDNGIIFVKDNLSHEETDIDNEDGSVTRPHQLLLNIFKKANLEVLAERKQYKFPKGLYEVKMFALR